MTTIRRLAQLVKDLETLRVIKAEDVSLFHFDYYSIMVCIKLSHGTFNSDNYLIKRAFNLEFPDELKKISENLDEDKITFLIKF